MSLREETENEKIAQNLASLLESIRDVERKVGRSEGSVKLLSVSKFHPASSVEAALGFGQRLFGENRVQEAAEKFEPLAEKFPDVELHIIGTLQKNKAARAVKICSCVESVDRLDLIKELEKQCAKIGKSIKIFFEYHTGEESKAGFATFDDLEAAVAFCAEGNAPHLVPAGFMTMAPFTNDESAIRASFVKLRLAAEKLRAEFAALPLAELSMGMSGDWKIAVEEGSTEVRIGTAIFGEREAT